MEDLDESSRGHLQTRDESPGETRVGATRWGAFVVLQDYAPGRGYPYRFFDLPYASVPLAPVQSFAGTFVMLLDRGSENIHIVIRESDNQWPVKTPSTGRRELINTCFSGRNSS